MPRTPELVQAFSRETSQAHYIRLSTVGQLQPQKTPDDKIVTLRKLSPLEPALQTDIMLLLPKKGPECNLL